MTSYADDAGVGAKLTVIGEFWTHLCEFSPRYGYYPEPTKSILVAHGGAQEAAASHFEAQRFKVVAGCRYLGGYLGDATGERAWLKAKATDWASAVEALTKTAHRHPQAAYSAMQMSLQAEWQFVRRVTQGTLDDFAPIKAALK